MAFTIPDSLWGSLVGALFGGLIASGIVAHLTQKWIEKRERRNRRDDLKLELYIEVVDLVLDNEWAIAERTPEGTTASPELQSKRVLIFHRLKLLASTSVQGAYKKYRDLVSKETENPISHRSKNPQNARHARDKLIELMAEEVQNNWGAGRPSSNAKLSLAGSIFSR